MKLVVVKLVLFQLQLHFSLSLMCNQMGTMADWWCVNQQTEAQFANSSRLADSCYCVVVKNMTQQQAFNNCTAVGGFLTDIQNVEENNLINIFLENASMSNETFATICGPDAKYLNGTCYSYNPKLKKTWFEAEKYCQESYAGGHLASVHSLTVQHFLHNLTKNCSDCTIYGFWVGGNNYGDPKNWTWSDGSAMDYKLEVTQYKGWAPQPEDPAHQQCITIWYLPSKPDGGWGDWFCTDSSNFVCSFPPPVFPSWIGLQKTLSGHAWNLGNNCNMHSPSFEAWDELMENPMKTAYVYQQDMTWSSMNPTSTAMTAVCRLDLNICGRNPCPSTANTCFPSKGGVACYTCM